MRNLLEGFIGIHSNGWNFADKSGIFVPFGANYFDPETGWAPKLWRMFNESRVKDHFSKMSDIGVNVARIFLTAASFQPESDSISKEALEKLDTMIDIAKQKGIRLILTGPDHWEGRPDYWGSDKYAGETALDALEFFWGELASHYKDETAIFAWDLLNEPEIHWKSDIMAEKWQLWLQSKYEAWSKLAQENIETATIPEDKIDPGSQKLYDYQLFRESIAYEWTKRQVDSIRAVDNNHLITVGFIQWSFPLLRAPWGGNAHQPGRYAAFNPLKLAPMLDFICIHFYPILGDPGDPKLKLDNTQYLQAVTNYCYAGKPVVIEEFGWYGGGEMYGKFRTESYQSEWNTNAVESTMGLASGWITWAFSDTPTSTDITKFGGLYSIEGNLKEWGKSFRSLSSRIIGSSRSDNFKIPGIDERMALTGDVKVLYEKYLNESGIAL